MFAKPWFCQTQCQGWGIWAPFLFPGSRGEKATSTDHVQLYFFNFRISVYSLRNLSKLQVDKKEKDIPLKPLAGNNHFGTQTRTCVDTGTWSHTAFSNLSFYSLHIFQWLLNYIHISHYRTESECSPVFFHFNLFNRSPIVGYLKFPFLKILLLFWKVNWF